MLRFDIINRTLQANQLAIQTTAHNLSNIETPGYSRQEVTFQAISSRKLPGVGQLGGGVAVTSIRRQVDRFLDERIREQSQTTSQLEEQQSWLQAVELALAPGDGDLLSRLNNLGASLNDLAANPEDPGLRTIAIADAEDIASSFHEMQKKFTQLIEQIQENIKEQVAQVNAIADKIAEVNQKLAQSTASPNDLLDQREQMLKELGQKVPLRVLEQAGGNVQVVVGNRLLVDHATATALQTQEQDGRLDVYYPDSTTALALDSGALGGALQVQNQSLPLYQERLDQMASGFINELNRLHSTGTGSTGGWQQLTSQETVANPLAPLAGEKPQIKSGTLTLRIEDEAGSTATQSDIAIDPASQSLQDIAGHLDSLEHVQAQVTGEGRLEIAAEAGYRLGFTEDSADLLIAMGINTLFQGNSAKNIAVSDWVRQDASQLALARSFAPGNNENALRIIIALEEQTYSDLQDSTFQEYWQTSISLSGEQSRSLQDSYRLEAQFLDDLKTRRSSLSGVSEDEELLNLQKYQHAYEAGARLFQIVNEMMETTINLG